MLSMTLHAGLGCHRAYAVADGRSAVERGGVLFDGSLETNDELAWLGSVVLRFLDDDAMQ